MIPTQSYRIWFVPRSGSTLLCKGLESTQKAGAPSEFFNVDTGKTLFDMHAVKSYEALKTKLWKLGTSPNGIFGAKHSYFSKRWKILMAEMCQMRQIENNEATDYEAVWADLFPNCNHIYLTRRNKVRQAVSWWKAIKDETWHIEANKSHSNPEEFYEQNYDLDALKHLLVEANLRDCAIQDYFSTYNIQPLTLVYEDYIENFEESIKTILEYLEIDTSDLSVGEKYYKRTANQASERWVQRFRQDLQASWDDTTW